MDKGKSDKAASENYSPSQKSESAISKKKSKVEEMKEGEKQDMMMKKGKKMQVAAGSEHSDEDEQTGRLAQRKKKLKE